MYVCTYSRELLKIENLKVSRDLSFTATKNKETTNKILAQENTKV